ncbi:MAG: hypothetical protein HY869_08995 [Chloroflexi bacterium]|nr:hypothetical protein [Chloroflexota bacterium]
MSMKRLSIPILLLVLVLAALQVETVQAQDGTPHCRFQPDGSIICTTGGGNEDGGGGNGDDGGVCTPGDHLVYLVTAYDPEAGTCDALPVWVDSCTGQVLESAGDAVDDMPCTLEAPPPEHPCMIFTVGGSGITCTNTEWQVSARVSFPEMFLDVRPYPASLVRWPTALRNGGQPASSGSGGVEYVPYGGGSPDSPQEGDWQDLRLTLTLRPAGPMSVMLPEVGSLSLPDVGAGGTPTLIQWQVPSHPAAGAGPLAGTISGLDELPGDIPLFVGSGRAPYRLFWELHYYEYEAIHDCIPGPGGNGGYNCGGGTGHKEIVGYEWKPHSNGGEIPPSEVEGLPPAIGADINGDGTPDAYWDNNLTLRRMDDANHVDNPRYQRSWNWGGIIYWAVREGQGQIGWPGR